MPSRSCAGVQRAVRVDVDAHHRSSHVRKPNQDDGRPAVNTAAIDNHHHRHRARVRAPAAGDQHGRAARTSPRIESSAATAARRRRRDCWAKSKPAAWLGRGGAAFPLAVKLRTVRDNGRVGGGAVVVANGEEGEPASIKDRWLLRNRPHLVLDGLRLAAAIVGADRAYVYVSDPESAHSVETALGELDPDTFGGIAVERV